MIADNTGNKTENYSTADGSIFEMVAKTFRGLEDVLYEEIKGIGATDIKKGVRAVSFRGDKSILYRANFQLRTALRILKPLFGFRARNEDELYKGAYNFDWSSLLDNKNTFAIDGVLHSEYFNHSKYVALKVKDAIADQFRAKTGKRPSVDTTDPDVRLNLHISNDKCTVLIDSSGDSLHKRGYRTATGPAPLNEVLAAGLIMLSGWNRQDDFIDPMCGSGTLPIEAAMLAWNIPPGIYRSKFAFESWHDYDPNLFESIYNQEQPEPVRAPVISGFDISPHAIRIARENARNAFLTRKISFKVSAIEDVIAGENGGVLVFNPPYGERLRENNLKAFHTRLGDCLKRNFAGYNAWMLTSNLDAAKFTGLRPEKKIVLYNGPLECRFIKYSLYKGSKKAGRGSAS